MENKDTIQLNLEKREQQLFVWAKRQLDFKNAEFKVVSGDASFRRYFRVIEGSRTVIAVDAPPTHENNEAFIGVAEGFCKSGLNVPEVFAVDLDNGFLLLSDLGDELLLPQLNGKVVDDWYQKAMVQLADLQQVSYFPNYKLPIYDEQRLMDEMHLMEEWFLKKHLNLTITTSEKKMLESHLGRLAELALSQPQVTVHRDFHSKNLMVMKNKQIGIIDFQDAVTGPISYDLISLIKDCYICWPQSMVDSWIEDFHKMLVLKEIPNLPSVKDFIFLSDAMAMQRHIKVLGIFSRLNYRDGKGGYLQDLPLTFKYIIETAKRYSEFKEFSVWLQAKVLPAFDLSQK